MVGEPEGSRGTGRGSTGEKSSPRLWRQQYNVCTQAESERAMCQLGKDGITQEILKHPKRLEALSNSC